MAFTICRDIIDQQRHRCEINVQNAAKTPAAGMKKPTAEEIRAYCKDKGYAIDAEHFLNYYEANGWKVTWSNLPKYLPGDVGKLITYKVEETRLPEGYHNSQSLQTADSEGKVTHTNVYEETEVTAKKQWLDDSNRDNKRPAVTFTLRWKLASESSFKDITSLWAAARLKVCDAEETPAVSATINAVNVKIGNEQTVVWSHLPAWINNEKVSYDVVETAPGNGYTISKDNTATETTTANPDEGEAKYKANDIIVNTRDVETVGSFKFTKNLNL